MEIAEDPIAAATVFEVKGSHDGLEWCAAKLPSPRVRPEGKEALRAQEVDGLEWCTAKLPTPRDRPEEKEATRAQEFDGFDWCAAKLPTPRKADPHKDEAGAQGAESVASYDSGEREEPPLQLNHDALRHIASYFLPGNRGKCLDITTLQRGAFHEIRELHFEDGSTCIGRFTRDKNEHLSVLDSETATVKYVRQHTSIRVPEIYFINRDPEHVVGAAFVIMEKLPGRHLYCFWDELSLNHKLSVIESITGVLAELIKLEFDAIGSLTPGGEIGALVDMAYSEDSGVSHGPFDNTLDYFLSFLKPAKLGLDLLAEKHAPVADIIRPFLQQEKDSPIYSKPFGLIHGDFDAQNMLFEWNGGEDSPRLTGIIDWDYSHSGPLYTLCEYPIFIQDNEETGRRKFYRQNKVLRKYFVQQLAGRFPRGSQVEQNVKDCFRQKNYTVQAFQGSFMGRQWSTEEGELFMAEHYAKCHQPDTEEAYYARAYGGKLFGKADSEMGSDDEVGEIRE